MISQAHIKCKKKKKKKADESQATSTKLLYVPLHAPGIIKWSMWRKIKVCLGGISPCRQTAWTWPPMSLDGSRLHGWGHFPHHTSHPTLVSPHKARLFLLFVFYLTSPPVKWMHGIYRQKSMPLIGLENWFTATLLSAFTYDGYLYAKLAVERSFGTKPPALS